MSELTRQVGASSDDAHRRLSDDFWNLGNYYVGVGAHDETYHEYGDGMRFTNITIPQGETINEAYLILRCNGSRSGTVCNSRISAEDVDDAPTFADDKAAFDTRWAARTTARVDWDAIPAWTVDVDYNSPEIKTVIQEIVDRGGWASGQDIVIFWDDFEDRSDHNVNAHKIADSYDTIDGVAPQLYIKYAVPVVVGRSFGFIIG